MALTATLPPTRALAMSALAVIGSNLLLVLSARVAVPFWPVPMTMQPFAMLLVAGFAGPGLATAAVAAYLVEGACGLPVFAGTPEHGVGLAYLSGPTGGYLLAMLPAAWVAGQAARLWPRRPALLFAGLLAAIAVVYLGGVAWLSRIVGFEHALGVGALPFIPGDVVKAALACAVLLATRRRHLA